jgi:hypothetical protein
MRSGKETRDGLSKTEAGIQRLENTRQLFLLLLSPEWKGVKFNAGACHGLLKVFSWRTTTRIGTRGGEFCIVLHVALAHGPQRRANIPLRCRSLAVRSTPSRRSSSGMSVLSRASGKMRGDASCFGSRDCNCGGSGLEPVSSVSTDACMLALRCTGGLGCTGAAKCDDVEWPSHASLLLLLPAPASEAGALAGKAPSTLMAACAVASVVLDGFPRSDDPSPRSDRRH